MPEMQERVNANVRPLVFGIYPGGAAAMPPRLPDDDAAIAQALVELQGCRERPFRVRHYMVFSDDLPARQRIEDLLAESGPGDLPLRHGHLLDLVVAYQSATGNVEGYTAFLRMLVRAVGAHVSTLQIAEEPNAVNNGGYVDGDFPRVREAVVQGMLAAKDEAQQQGLDHLRTGFNVIPSFGDGFFASLRDIGGEAWLRTVDFVGLDCFPGVWMIPEADPAALGDAVVLLLDWLRHTALPEAGIPEGVPVIIAENGWSTGPGSSPERQAAALEHIIRAVAAHRETYNVEGYTLFSLRDADSTNPDPFAQFGILYDDYTRKPAFTMYGNLIAELG